MKGEEVHPILKGISFTTLGSNISERQFLSEQNIPINMNEKFIGRVANCSYAVEITSLGNQEVQDILLKSQLSQESLIFLWLSDVVLETEVQNFIEFWEEFCFASVNLLLFKTKPSNIVGEYFKYHGREHFGLGLCCA